MIRSSALILFSVCSFGTLAFSQTAYIADNGLGIGAETAGGYVSILDLHSQRETSALPFAKRSVLTLALSPDGEHLYASTVTISDSGYVGLLAILNAQDGSVEGQVKLSSTNTVNLLVSKDARYVVAVEFAQETFFRGTGNYVDIVDTVEKKIAKTISFPNSPTSYPTGAFLDATKQAAYVDVITYPSAPQAQWNPKPTLSFSEAATAAYYRIDLRNLEVTPVSGAAPQWLYQTETPDGKTAFLAGSGKVYAVDTSTLALTTLPGLTEVWGIAVSPDGTTVYEIESDGNQIAAISVASGTLTILGMTLPYGTVGLGISNDGSTLIIPTDFNEVDLFDIASATVLTSIPVGQQPISVAVEPSGSKVFVSDYGPGIIQGLDVNTLAETHPLESTYVTNLAASPDGSTLFGLAQGPIDSNQLTAINLKTHLPINSLAISANFDSGFAYIASSPSGSRLYVSYSDYVEGGSTTYPFVAVDTASGASLGSVELSNYGPVTVTPDGQRAFVNIFSLVALTLDPLSIQYQAQALSPYSYAGTVVFDPTDGLVYSALENADFYSDGAIGVTDSASGTFLKAIPVPIAKLNVYPPIAEVPGTGIVYIGNPNGNEVYVVNTITGSVSEPLSMPGPMTMQVTPDGTEVWVFCVNETSAPTNSLSIIDTATNTVTSTIALPVAATPGFVIANSN